MTLCIIWQISATLLWEYIFECTIYGRKFCIGFVRSLFVSYRRWVLQNENMSCNENFQTRRNVSFYTVFSLSWVTCEFLSSVFASTLRCYIFANKGWRSCKPRVQPFTDTCLVPMDNCIHAYRKLLIYRYRRTSYKFDAYTNLFHVDTISCKKNVVYNILNILFWL